VDFSAKLFCDGDGPARGAESPIAALEMTAGVQSNHAEIPRHKSDVRDANEEKIGLLRSGLQILAARMLRSQ
jgi:hypothetical protein